MRTGKIVFGLVLAALVFGERAEAGSRDVVRIVGSSTVFAFAATVAEAIGRTTEFKAPVIEATGTGGGFKLFCAGIGIDTPDIVTASRPMTADERALCAANGVKDVDISVHGIGFDGVALVESRKGGDLPLTRRQLWLALARMVPVEGKLVPNPHTRWNEVDATLPDRPIRVYGPPPTSGTRDVFAEVVMEGGCSAFRALRGLGEEERREACEHMREDAVYVEAGEDDDMVVRRMSGDDEAIGIVGYNALLRHAHLVKGLALEGVVPDADTIASGDYPVSRELYLYVKTPHFNVVPGLSAYLKEFTGDTALGEDGYLAGIGLVPPPGVPVR